MKDRLFGERRVSALVFPCVVSLFIYGTLTASVLKIKPPYGTRMMIAALAVSVVWIVLWMLDSRRIVKGKTDNTLKVPPIAALILSAAFGFYLTWTVWGNGYLTLAPLEQIDNGTQHLDTMFLSSIAESFRRSLLPRVLMNNEQVIPYHTFSSLLLAGAAAVTGAPAFIAYNYLYPVLFIPVWVLAMIMGMTAAKEYFADKNGIGIPELTVMILVTAGFIYRPWLDGHGIWKKNLVISESFLIANTLMFLSYGVIFRCLKYPGEGSKRRSLLLYVFIPASIFLISWSKISTGLLYTCSVMYYLFRVHIRKLKYWGLNVFYGVFLLAGLWLFKMSGDGIRGMVRHAFDFGEYCRKGILGLPGHYLILLILPVIFCILEFRRLRNEKEIFRTGKTVWIEDLLLVALASFLPGMVIVMDGGSAVYFSMVTEIPAMLLVCGHPGFRLPEGTGKKVLSVLCVVWCAAMCWFNKPEDPMSFVTGEHASNLSGILAEIREEYGQHPEEYAIYLDPDNIASRIFGSESYKSDYRSIYVWPAMTGISVIDATHMNHVGNAYTYHSNLIYQSDNYKGEFTDTFDRPLTLDEALEKAAQMGKKGIIRVTADGYEFIGIE